MVGKTEDEARSLIEDAGFQVSRVTDSTTKAKKGTVLQQSPNAGQTLDKGSTVTIVVSTYEEPKPEPEPTPPTQSASPLGRRPAPDVWSVPVDGRRSCSALA